LNRLPRPASNEIQTDNAATRSSAVLRPGLAATPLAVTHLGSNVNFLHQ
jgi:hypothetical protein